MQLLVIKALYSNCNVTNANKPQKC